MAPTPIKRNKNILTLSREHHAGLLFCWKIKQGINKTIELETIINYVSYFWNNHLYKHFEEEEDYLFVKTDDKCIKALKQHQEIRLLFKNINDHDPGLNYDLLIKLTNSLVEHIRFEERELFPHLEKILDEHQLAKIGALLEQSQKIPFKDNFQDEFWI